MYTTCKNAILNGNLGSCEPLGLSLADWATILGLIIVILGGLKFLAAPIARFIGWGDKGNIHNFSRLKKVVRRLARDNSRIFRTFGPKSRATDEGLDQFDVAAWHKVRLKIKGNNEEILPLLKKYFHLIPVHYQAIFTKWINHIEAFSAHLEDPAVDYRHHQFPVEIDEILNS